MTTDQNPAAEQPAIEVAPQQVKPKANSRLAQLHEQWTDAKAEEKAASERCKAITDAIKLELTQAAAEGATKVDLVPANGVQARPLRLSWVESWKLDSRALKKADPETYVRFAKKSGYWTLGELKGDGGESE